MAKRLLDTTTAKAGTKQVFFSIDLFQELEALECKDNAFSLKSPFSQKVKVLLESYTKLKDEPRNESKEIDMILEKTFDELSIDQHWTLFDHKMKKLTGNFPGRKIGCIKPLNFKDYGGVASYGELAPDKKAEFETTVKNNYFPYLLQLIQLFVLITTKYIPIPIELFVQTSYLSQHSVSINGKTGTQQTKISQAIISFEQVPFIATSKLLSDLEISKEKLDVIHSVCPSIPSKKLYDETYDILLEKIRKNKLMSALTSNITSMGFIWNIEECCKSSLSIPTKIRI